MKTNYVDDDNYMDLYESLKGFRHYGNDCMDGKTPVDYIPVEGAKLTKMLEKFRKESENEKG
ncbi:MAG: hypothetical protein FWE45_01810 [Firmicutes bacterium]|nr:hypothetical protein [Bacillota bacterium]